MAKKRKKKKIGKKEFLFNFFSLLIIMCIGIYFGGRSFYYYSKQNNTLNSEISILSEKIVANNRVTKGGDGLHQDKEGYYFKGSVKNNYVKFANRDFRIIRLNKDNTIKLISEDNASVFMWGDDSSYKKSNLYFWLNKTNNKNTGIYYETLPSVEKFLVKTKYREDKLLESKVEKSNEVYSDYISILTIDDYVNASGKNSYLNNGKYSWVIGHDQDDMNLYINEEGSLEGTGNYESYGIRPVITLKKNIKIASGDGTKDNPYVIKQGKDINYVDQYVKLGNDMWKVYRDNGGVLRLSLFKYVGNGTTYNESRPFSNNTSEFNTLDYNNIGYYLNNQLVPNLSYSNIMLDTNYFIGEISNDTSLNYSNIFTNVVNCKMGLLNIFDYNPTNNLTDYYLINTMSTVGSMAYVYNNLGLLEEANVVEEKYIVPTISIEKKVLKKGNGTLENPYTME
ncbi:MAG: hypothetical protein E7160_04105 [Firmicutes bacterium]|nr:hypothetical protein [Bacillota bacterium]